MIRKIVLLLVITVIASGPAFAQGGDDVLSKIREEGLERSQVMETVHVLTDRYGPRLTGSPSLVEAGDWVLERLQGLGLSNAHREAWDWGHEGWENERFSGHILSPVRQPLVGEVLGWTPSTNGPLAGEVYHLDIPFQPTEEELNAYFLSVADDPAGKIVLVGNSSLSSFSVDFPERREDVQVQAEYHPFSSGGRRFRREPRREGALEEREIDARVREFLVAQGAIVQVNPAKMVDGLIRAFGNRSYDTSTAIPTVILRNEDYGRIERLSADDLSVELEFDIENKVYPEGATAYNFVAEIPGSEFPDQVVMLGGHLDSWHAGTGATDNAAGSAIMMEAVRIVKALGLEPRRTIRIALWSGEEQGLLGSQAYVERHFGTFENPKDEYFNFGGYINVDSGTGKLRGASVFGPRDAAVVLHEMMIPLHDQGMFGARST
ncbi:MAG: M20/M25/M40 family metallo-hydrolase, partial [Bacteroidetes bacterium]|nr:M20/M25/M40 family metallo-hydrolase [Bacteroidota bacterium]